MEPFTIKTRAQMAESRPAVSEAAPRLLLLTDARDAEGQPRVALSLPTLSTGRRAALVIFPIITAALAELRRMEASR